jgi:hypothetical protein
MIYDLFKDWDGCRHIMLPAIERTNGTHTEDDVLIGLMKGQLKLWRSQNSAVVTEFIEYPRMKVLGFFLIGGDLDELLNELEPTICAFAAANGCKRVQGGGRKGWERVLNYEYGGTHMYKDLP